MAVDLALALLVPLLFLIAVFALFRDTRFTFAVFRYLITASLLLAIFTFARVGIRLTTGAITTSGGRGVAIFAMIIALAVGLYVVFGIREDTT